MSDTRLPAAAKHNAINAINVAQTRYATGAAAPSPAATVAGIRKIDDAIVTLMMLAVSSRVPITRTSCTGSVIHSPNLPIREIVRQRS